MYIYTYINVFDIIKLLFVFLLVIIEKIIIVAQFRTVS